MRKILSSNKGFSLIELIVVIAILGVLVGVAAPNLIGYVEKTRVATDISNVEVVRRAAETYYAEHGDDTGFAIGDVVKILTDGKMPILKSKLVKDGTTTDGVITVTEDTTNHRVVVTPDEATIRGTTPPASTE